MKKRVWFLGLGLIFLLTWFVQAQPPLSGLLPFSGTIPDRPDGPVALRLRLFPTAVGGTHCFEETQTVEVTDGQFFTLLGLGSARGVPPSPCFTNNVSLWVAYALDSAPATELGERTPLFSAGFALFALTPGGPSGPQTTQLRQQKARRVPHRRLRRAGDRESRGRPRARVARAANPLRRQR